MNNYNRGGRPQQNLNNEYRGGNDRYNNDGYNQNHHGRDGRDGRDGREFNRDGRGNSSRPAGNNFHGMKIFSFLGFCR